MTGDWHLWQRVAGGCLLLLGVVFMNPDSTHWAHQLLIPMSLALAAWWLTGALLAVALACLCLSLVHVDLSSSDWVLRWAYPALAAASLVTALVLLARRFRAYARATHDARWQNRT